MQIARVPSWSGPEWIAWLLFFFADCRPFLLHHCLVNCFVPTLTTYIHTTHRRIHLPLVYIVIILIRDTSMHCFIPRFVYNVFHNAPAWDVTCIKIRYNAFLSLFWIQPSWSRFVDLKSKTAWQADQEPCGVPLQICIQDVCRILCEKIGSIEP